MGYLLCDDEGQYDVYDDGLLVGQQECHCDGHALVRVDSYHDGLVYGYNYEVVEN